MKKLIIDAIFSRISIIYFDAINAVIEQTIKNNKKNAIKNASNIKYNKN